MEKKKSIIKPICAILGMIVMVSWVAWLICRIKCLSCDSSNCNDKENSEEDSTMSIDDDHLITDDVFYGHENKTSED